MRRLLGPILLLAAALVAVPLPAQADTSDFTFDSYHADYTLTRLDDGTSHLEVVETIAADVPEPGATTAETMLRISGASARASAIVSLPSLRMLPMA